MFFVLNFIVYFLFSSSTEREQHLGRTIVTAHVVIVSHDYIDWKCTQFRGRQRHANKFILCFIFFILRKRSTSACKQIMRGSICVALVIKCRNGHRHNFPDKMCENMQAIEKLHLSNVLSFPSESLCSNGIITFWMWSYNFLPKQGNFISLQIVSVRDNNRSFAQFHSPVGQWIRKSAPCHDSLVYLFDSTYRLCLLSAQG